MIWRKLYVAVLQQYIRYKALSLPELFLVSVTFKGVKHNMDIKDGASISFVDVNEGLRRILIIGRFDILGNDEISQKFAMLTTEAPKRVVVDLSNVSYLA